jgi:cystathionine gamma-synthase
MGSVMGSLEAWLLLRSLKTFPLRIGQQAWNAQVIAAYLDGRTDFMHSLLHGSNERKGDISRLPPPLSAGWIDHVWHASLPYAPGHAFSPDGPFSPVLSIELSSVEAAVHLPNLLRVFQNATSLGGVESLIDYRYQHSTDVSPKLCRLSIGVEHVLDLLWDLYDGIRKVYQLHGKTASRL